jgi:hypothetical protein
MLTSDEYEITGSDVHEVIQWADDHATGRTYSLWVCVPEGTDDRLGLNLVRLAGWDPTASDFSRPAHAVGVPSTASTGLV